MPEAPTPQPPPHRFARGGLFSAAQIFGWAAVLFDGCVARNCQDVGQGDQLGAGFVLVLALGAAVVLTGLASVALGVASAAVTWTSKGLRWAGIALAICGVAAALGAADAVRQSACRYTGGAACVRSS